MSERSQDIAEAVASLREHLDGLGGRGVEILAVSKGFPWSDVCAAMVAGLDTFGENYAQEIVTKYSAVPPDERPTLHFIGRLQSNKIALLAPFVTTWESVDRVRLVEEIARRAPGSTVLVQVNVTGESDKGGCLPGEVDVLVGRARSVGLSVAGLMVVGPTSGDRDLTRKAFRKAAQLREGLGLAELSMGMSDDLDIAIEEGSTRVRVGSALFGRRPPKD